MVLEPIIDQSHLLHRFGEGRPTRNKAGGKLRWRLCLCVGSFHVTWFAERERRINSHTFLWNISLILFSMNEQKIFDAVL
jgi:hypothetical protein